MIDFDFIQWLAIVGPLGIMMLFLYNRIVKTDERIEKSNERWLLLLKDFCDFKNVTVERFSKLENKKK